MHRASRLGLTGLAVAGLGWGLVAGGPLRARQIPGASDFHPAGPSNVQFVEAPPRSVAWTRTWLQLQKVVPLEYPDGIKLGDLLKRVREETRAPELGFPRGVPIYVERAGLAEADRTLDSEVTIDLDGVALGKALRLALRLALRSIHLATELNDDGLVVVTSASTDCDHPVEAGEANWQALGRLSEEITELRAEVRALREALRPHLAGIPPRPEAPAVPAPAPSTGGGFR